MLKILMVSFIYIISTVTCWASNCVESASSKGQECSDEYFQANDVNELSEYLENGKFKDGKLLNLQLNFNVVMREVNITSGCNIKISKGRNIHSTMNGICLKGKNIYLEGGNNLFADMKSPVNLNSDESLILVKSNLRTKGNIHLEVPQV